MCIYNENEQIPEELSDEEVQANLFRVQAADALEQCRKEAE